MYAQANKNDRRKIGEPSKRETVEPGSPSAAVPRSHLMGEPPGVRATADGAGVRGLDNGSTMERFNGSTNETAALRANKLAVIDFVLSHTLRLFHPVLPFI